MPSLENGNRYEGEWQQGMKNGQGRFFHLDRGQLFEGFWQDDVAKCGTMTDYGRDEAPKPTKFPIPEVGSQPSPEGPPDHTPRGKPEAGLDPPGPHLRRTQRLLFSARTFPGRRVAPRGLLPSHPLPKAGTSLGLRGTPS